MAGGDRPVEHGQNALVGRLGVLRVIAALARLVEAGEPTLGGAHPPLRRRARGAANLAADGACRQPVRRQQHNPRPLPQPVLRLRRAGQSRELGPLLLRQ
jgi:hypothetical protein